MRIYHHVLLRIDLITPTQDLTAEMEGRRDTRRSPYLHIKEEEREHSRTDSQEKKKMHQ